MTLSIAHNLAAAQTAQNLGTNYAKLSKSVQRLSSGLRITKAADDAAGMATAELMRANITTFHQGIRNTQDAISLIQVADGALAVIDEKIIRMKELAEQAATGTYNSVQRLMLDSEYQQMASEIDRIAKATDFNGIKLLDGSLDGVHNGSGLISTGALKIHFGSSNDSAEDYYYLRTGNATAGGLGLGDLVLDIAQRVGGTGSPADSTVTGYDFYQLPLGLTNVTIVSNAAEEFAHKPHICIFTKDGVQLTGPAMPLNAGDNPQWISNEGTKSNWWNNRDATTIFPQLIAAGIMNPGAQLDNTNVISSGISPVYPGLQITAAQNESRGVDEVIHIDKVTDDLVFLIGGHLTGHCNNYKLRVDATGVSLKTQDNAQNALIEISKALLKKDAIRAHLGAMQNRLENTVTNLEIMAENLQASESRIVDTDIATEMTNYICSSILTQSGVAMLVNANNLPQMAIQLLQE